MKAIPITKTVGVNLELTKEEITDLLNLLYMVIRYHSDPGHSTVVHSAIAERLIKILLI